MPELREKLLAPCVVVDPGSGQVIDADVGALLLRILLFEGNMIDSIRLQEFPHLVRVLGVDQVRALLDDGELQINCDARTFGRMGQKDSAGNAVGSFDTHDIRLISLADRDEYIGGALQEMQKSLLLPLKKEIKLKRSIVRRIIDPPETLGQAATAQMRRALADNRDVCRISLGRSLQQAGHQVDVSTLRIEIEELSGDDPDFRTRTNLSLLGIEPNEEQELVGSALLGVGGINLRLEEMQTFQVISGFRDSELPIFDAKLDFLAAQITPETQAARFQRVLTLAGLPDPGEALAQGVRINIDKLLAVRESSECREFRSWLRTLDENTDREIEDRVNGLRARVSEVFQSGTGRVIRFAAVTGSGFVPVAGLPLSLGLGALDSFALDRILGDPGPSAFLSTKYKSLFDGS